ncbi:hypothetical protein J19TS2_36260 [Cohnella xylanilytica]|uniref:PA14 domain-containing protein n=1 Tax=Cohnella xylanilytica TaxID=557555 RepID=UPI001B18BEBE|nr:PA14 domain-containing protein [Cohnella xylanilytica]GIO14071.1 hypothetical protein J19TS2_36260 [Cohnella xylanilytica]
MKKNLALLSRLLAAAVLWTSIGSSGFEPVHATTADSSGSAVNDAGAAPAADGEAATPAADGEDAASSADGQSSDEAPIVSLAIDDSVLIDKNSSWSYLDDGSSPDPTWREVSFDDGAWSSAAAPLGYAASGKGQDLATVIGYGSDESNKPITVYFRKKFQVSDADRIKNLAAALIRDDGAVLYLNGHEVKRSNMPATGTITGSTPASSAVADERVEESFSIDPDLLVSGTNVLAAEVHQNAATSSDLIFSLSLTGSATAPAESGAGQGLLAEYYAGNSDFSFGDYKATTVDSQINFTNLDPALQTWTGSQDHANVRWTGQIAPPESGEYTFYMMGDNGFRLWVDGRLVIDHWVNDWDKEQTGIPIALEAGKKYDFKVEYFEDFGGSNLYLRWSTPTLTKTIVPVDAFYLPQAYTGPMTGSVTMDGKGINLGMTGELSELPSSLKDHLTVAADGVPVTISGAEPGADASVLHVTLASAIKPGQRVSVSYDGQAGLQFADGTAGAAFRFSPVNLREDYSPFAIAMTFNGSPKTSRAFAWYTNYAKPDNAPSTIMDSIVEVVPADQDFDSAAVMRFVGDSKDTQILENLNLGSTTGSFISHKAIATGLTPGMAYKYRVGSDGNWSQTGRFTTEGDNENEYEFLYMTDSQGANTEDYRVWANSLKNAMDDYPDARFLVMPGDLVDAGAREDQWFDYFGQPQDLLMNLPLMATIGNHEGPNNNNFLYHFNLPDDSHTDPKPRGTVYSFDYGPAHIMVLNTGDIPWDEAQTNSFNKQIEWLRKEVAQTDKEWKIVAFHKAIYSVGNHATDSDIAELRKKLYPVLDELGIDLVLQGHDHTFMRSYQMYNNQPVTDVQTDVSGRLMNPDGTLYMINNSPGRKYYQINQNVDKYFAATYQQPNKPIYSGVQITEDSLTINTYISGEDTPFDTYTIMRKDDSRPNPVERLTAGESEGKTVLSWTKPADKSAEDAVRGFRIYEVDGKLGMNWSAYVPVTAGQEDYQYVVPGTDSRISYEFAVRAVDKRDNSVASIVNTTGTLPAAPTDPSVDDGHNAFGWTNVPGYSDLADYEYSLDGGANWQPVTANPQPVGDAGYAAGQVMVRVKANEALGTEAGMPLASDKAFTSNGIRDTFLLKGSLKRGDQLQLDLSVEKLAADYSGAAYLVIEALNGDTPILINAVPIKQDKVTISHYFNANGTSYKLKAFVVDQFDTEPNVPVQLARPILFQ